MEFARDDIALILVKHLSLLPITNLLYFQGFIRIRAGQQTALLAFFSLLLCLSLA